VEKTLFGVRQLAAALVFLKRSILPASLMSFGSRQPVGAFASFGVRRLAAALVFLRRSMLPVSLLSVRSRQLAGAFACDSHTPYRKRRQAAALQRGFSLMEVLVSIFVVLFAVLSLAALVPVARFELAKATIADRSVICGHEALQDVQLPRTEGLGASAYSDCNPNAWVFPADTAPYSSVVWPTPPVTVLGSSVPVIDARQAYAIDPLYCAYCANYDAINGLTGANAILPRANYLPYADPVSGIAGLVSSSPPVTLPLAMQRVMVGMPTSLSAAAQVSYYDRLFTFQDDLGFGKPLADQLRPQRTGLEGAFSWLATVWPTPGPEDISATTGGTYPNNVPWYQVNLLHYYQVSVAVFNRRDFSPPPTAAPADNQPPSERAVIATFSGGGDVMLYAPLASQSTYLNLRENDWLLLCGQQSVLSLQGSTYTRNTFGWYRVVATSAIEQEISNQPTNGLYRRRVTVAGQDWNPAWCFSVPAGGSTVWGAQAVLFNGIIGVYSTQIQQ
jgi:hypothetical protein